jgi:hypothetical protein
VNDIVNGVGYRTCGRLEPPTGIFAPRPEARLKGPSREETNREEAPDRALRCRGPVRHAGARPRRDQDRDRRGTTLTWTGSFKAKGALDAKAEEVIGGIYEGGLKGIADKAS